MPELPDIEVFTQNLHTIFAGKKLLHIKIKNGKKLKDRVTILRKNLEGKILCKIYRSGKEMRFEFSGKTLLGLHLMLTGDVFLFEKHNEHKFTIVEFYFKGGKNLALTDRMGNANIKLNPVDKEGIDAISRKLNYNYLKKVFNSRSTVKNLLINQDIIRGIGNSYSDEILWEARISPFSIANAIPDDKLKTLPALIKKILKREIKNINKHYKGIINTEVKDFLKIHTKKTHKSPTGKSIIIKKTGSMKTYYTKEQVLYI